MESLHPVGLVVNDDILFVFFEGRLLGSGQLLAKDRIEVGFDVVLRAEILIFFVVILVVVIVIIGGPSVRALEDRLHLALALVGDARNAEHVLDAADVRRRPQRHAFQRAMQRRARVDLTF